jgi:hypothetical protein
MASARVAQRVLRLAPIIVTAVVAALIAGPDDASLAKARSSRVPPEKRVGLRPGLQLAAMRHGIAEASHYFSPYQTSCTRTVPVIAFVQGQTMAGNFRDQDGGCYVWLNLAQAPLLDAQEICKLALHESGHLGGYAHSSDPDDVMFSPFESQPIPAPCRTPLN